MADLQTFRKVGHLQVRSFIEFTQIDQQLVSHAILDILVSKSVMAFESIRDVICVQECEF